MKKQLLALALLSSFGAMSQTSPLEGYTPSGINSNMTSEVWNNMKTDFKSGSECFNRALSWTYDLDKMFGIKSKKILIHYSYKYNQELSSKWGFHIAPVINVDGEDTVFDKGFQPWIHTPLSKQMWEDKFLIAGTEKLVEKRIKLADKLKDKKEDYRDLDRSSENYRSRAKSIREDIKEIIEEMKYFKVTDEELKEQRPLKIAQTKRTIKHHQDAMETFDTNSAAYRSAKNQVDYHTRLLDKVMNDFNYSAHIQCKKISHIEELDFNLTKEWCYIQETSMYYWGIPQLRLLNYGQYDRPYENQVSSLRRNGAQYALNEYNMEQVWLARKQAFGSDYKDLWKKEYDAKEAAEDKVKEDKKKAKREAKELRKRQKEKERAARRRARERRRNS